MRVRGGIRKANASFLAILVAVGAILVLVTSAGATDPSRVASCKGFTLFRGHDKYSGQYTFRASGVRHSAAIRCSMTRKLLKAAYAAGPLHVTRTVYEHDARGRRVGRPTYWLRGGWRCGNGAGGANCWNAAKPQFNAILYEGVTHGFAVAANTRVVG